MGGALCTKTFQIVMCLRLGQGTGHTGVVHQNDQTVSVFQALAESSEAHHTFETTHICITFILFE